MKTNLHPTDYRPVVFSDDVAGFAFLTQSTAQTKENIKWEDGNEYPLIKFIFRQLATHSLLAKKKLLTPKAVLIDIRLSLQPLKLARLLLPARLSKLKP